MDTIQIYKNQARCGPSYYISIIDENNNNSRPILRVGFTQDQATIVPVLGQVQDINTKINILDNLTTFLEEDEPITFERGNELDEVHAPLTTEMLEQILP